MSIIDLDGAEVIAVKLRVSMRARYVSDIDNEFNSIGAKQLDELQKCARGMSNGKKARGQQVILHVDATLAGSVWSLAEESGC